jgi:hypothetical protein
MNITFKLYESDGLTLRYTFPYVYNSNYPKTINKHTEIQGHRGDNSIIILGGKSSWDLVLQGYIYGKNYNYEDVTSDIDSLESFVVFGSPYYIKIDKTEGGASVYSYKVKRVKDIEYLDSLRNGRSIQKYSITLKVNAW